MMISGLPGVRHRPQHAVVAGHVDRLRHRHRAHPRRVRAVAAPGGRLLVGARAGPRSTPSSSRPPSPARRDRRPALRPGRPHGSVARHGDSGSILGVGLSGITFFKGRLFLGVVAIFIWPVGLWCAIRLAKPTSPWAHRFYEGHREHSSSGPSTASAPTAARPSSAAACRTPSEEPPERDLATAALARAATGPPAVAGEGAPPARHCAGRRPAAAPRALRLPLGGRRAGPFGLLGRRALGLFLGRGGLGGPVLPRRPRAAGDGDRRPLADLGQQPQGQLRRRLTRWGCPPAGAKNSMAICGRVGTRTMSTVPRVATHTTARLRHGQRQAPRAAARPQRLPAGDRPLGEHADARAAAQLLDRPVQGARASPLPRSMGIWPMPSRIGTSGPFHSVDLASARICRRRREATPMATGSQ